MARRRIPRRGPRGVRRPRRTPFCSTPACLPSRGPPARATGCCRTANRNRALINTSGAPPLARPPSAARSCCSRWGRSRAGRRRWSTRCATTWPPSSRWRRGSPRRFRCRRSGCARRTTIRSSTAPTSSTNACWHRGSRPTPSATSASRWPISTPTRRGTTSSGWRAWPSGSASIRWPATAPRSTSEPDDPDAQALLLRRALLVVAHETGHMFSLPHCRRYECLMNGMNSLAELDRGTPWLCPDCLRKLQWNVGLDVLAHYRALRTFYHGPSDARPGRLARPPAVRATGGTSPGASALRRRMPSANDLQARWAAAARTMRSIERSMTTTMSIAATTT